MKVISLGLGLSTGRSKLGLCLTQNRLEEIEWWKISPVADRRSRWVGRIRPSTSGGRVGRHHRSKITSRKRWGNFEKKVRKTHIRGKSHRNLWDFTRSSENLTEFNEILPYPIKISPDLHEISPESGFFSQDLKILPKFGFFFLPESGKFSLEFGIFDRIWVFVSRFRFFGFWGRETKTNSPKSVSGEEDLPPTAEVVG